MKKPLVIALVMGLAGGCASQPDHLDAKFGTSVKQSIVQQIYNPGASQANESRTVTSLDGQKAAKTLEKYRTGEQPAAAKSRAVTFDFSK